MKKVFVLFVLFVVLAMAMATEGMTTSGGCCESGKIYAAFDTGVWEYNGTGWKQITASIPTELLVVNGQVIGSFPKDGVWKYDGKAWKQLTNSTPIFMVK